MGFIVGMYHSADWFLCFVYRMYPSLSGVNTACISTLTTCVTEEKSTITDLFIYFLTTYISVYALHLYTDCHDLIIFSLAVTFKSR